MKIFERVCCVEGCGKRYGCKFVNRSGDVITWSCDTCLLSNLGKECLHVENNKVEQTHGYCPKHSKEIKDG